MMYLLLLNKHFINTYKMGGELIMKKYVCPVCGYVHEGDTPPEKCPLCKVPGEKFTEMTNAEKV